MRGLAFFVDFIKKLLQMGYGVAATGSSRNSAGKIFPVHYKECRLVNNTVLYIAEKAFSASSMLWTWQKIYTYVSEVEVHAAFSKLFIRTQR